MEPTALNDGFATWYRTEWRGLVAGLTATFGGDRGLAEEAAAEACTRAFARWTQVSSAQSPTAWAYRVGVNYGKRRMRRRSMEMRKLATSTPADVHLDDSNELLDMLGGLPARQREVVVMRYFLDMNQEQIAASLHIAPGSVAASLHKARTKLADRLRPPVTRPFQQTVHQQER